MKSGIIIIYACYIASLQKLMIIKIQANKNDTCIFTSARLFHKKQTTTISIR